MSGFILIPGPGIGLVDFRIVVCPKEGEVLHACWRCLAARECLLWESSLALNWSQVFCDSMFCDSTRCDEREPPDAQTQRGQDDKDMW